MASQIINEIFNKYPDPFVNLCHARRHCIDPPACCWSSTMLVWWWWEWWERQRCIKRRWNWRKISQKNPVFGSVWWKSWSNLGVQCNWHGYDAYSMHRGNIVDKPDLSLHLSLLTCSGSVNNIDIRTRGMNSEPGKSVQYVCLHTGDRRGAWWMSAIVEVQVITNNEYILMNVGSFSSYSPVAWYRYRVV